MNPVNSGLVLSLESDGAFSLDNSTITSWEDGSGSGNTLFAAGDPQLAAGETPTGMSAVLLDGDGDRLSRTAADLIAGLPGGSSDRTVFFVVDYVDPEGVNSGFAYGDNQKNETFGLIASKNSELTVQGYGGTQDIKSPADGVTGGFLVQSAVVSAGALTHYKDGTLIDTEAHAYATDVQTILLGADMGGGGESQMKVAAVLVYDRALSDSERQQVESYLQTKYISGPVISPPNAVDDTVVTYQAVPATFDVLANDGDGDGDPFDLTAVTAPSHGTATIDDNGTPGDATDDKIVYAPDPGHTGSDSFTYTITGDDGSDTANVNVTVRLTPGTNPPVATDDTAATVRDTPVLVAVLDNDSDLDGDALAIVAAGGASHGMVSIDDNGTPVDTTDDRIHYVPETDYVGADSFTYTIADDDGSATATVSVDVTLPPLLIAPTAYNDAVVTNYNTAVLIDVMANDTDPTDDAFAITALSSPSNGTAVIDDNGTPLDGTDDRILYTPDSDFSGADSFTYTITDDDGSDDATVTVEVVPEATQGPLSMSGFRHELVMDRTGIEPDFQPISMAFLPDNRMLLVSKSGVIRVVDPETGNSSVYMTLNANTDGERGVLDITLDPDFATNGYFYLYYTPSEPQNAQIARFQHVENSGGLTSTGNAGSKFVVWQDTDGYIKCCHYGAGLDFGPDDKLWLTASDKFQSSTGGEGNGDDRMLDLTSSSGKIIRINSDGTIPDGSDGWAANPFIDGPGGNDDSIWAYGLRNPFRARWDVEYGQMYIAEVGGNQQEVAEEDLHTASLDQAGAFYGWPFYEGDGDTYTSDGSSAYNPTDFPLPDGDIADAASGDYYSSPIWSLPHDGSSASLTGGEVYRGDMFPTQWDGVYFYGDYTRDYIRYLVLDDSGLEVLGDYTFSETLGVPMSTIASIAVGNDGALYYARIAGGKIGRFVYEGGDTNAAPQVLSSNVSPKVGDLPLLVTFTATVLDTDGDALIYNVNFGDGSTAVIGDVADNGMVSVQHTYATDGAFNVTFSVSDGSKTAFSPKYAIQAGDVNFSPIIEYEQADLAIADPGTDLVTFTATVSDPDGDLMSYIWHFGDGHSESGTVPDNGAVSVSHVFETDGTYGAYLEVSDGSETAVSDNVTVQVGEATTFPVGEGLVLLLESDIKIGLGSGNTVTSWLDGSGQGNNLSAQGDPQLLDNQTSTGLPAIVFDGDGDLLQRINASQTLNNLPSGGSDRTIFFVVDYVDPEGVSAGLAYGTPSGNKTFGLVSNNNGQLAVQGYGGRNDFPSGVNGVNGGFLVQSAILSSGTVSHYKNGAMIDTDTHNFATVLEKLVLGAEIKNAGETQMKVAAVLIYDRALSEPERQQVEAFLQGKYISGSSDTAPVAADDSGISTLQGVAVTIDVLANDSDADGDPFDLVSVAAPAHGTAVIDDNGTPGDATDDRIVYTPDSGYFGEDSFIYTISGDEGSDTAMVSVTVPAPPGASPPVAAADRAVTAMNVAVLIDVMANDDDPDGDAFAITATTTPTNGTVVIDDNGTPGDATDDLILYNPASGFAGQDSFTYTISDEDGSDNAIVTVTVGADGGLVHDGLVAAYQSDGQVSTSGDIVVNWLDESGFGNDLEAAGDPRFVQNATPTGAAAIVFDGVGDLLERVEGADPLNSLPAGSHDRTLFFVVNHTGSNRTSVGLSYGDGAGNESFGLTTARADQSLTLQGYSNANDFDSGVASSGWGVQSVVLDDDVFRHYYNGSLIDEGTHSFATDVQRLVIGDEISGAATKAMDVAAVFIYDQALDEADRISMESYLQQKFIDDAFAYV